MNNNEGSPEWSKEILCRNVSVYGFCKNESSCIYNHGEKKEFNMNSESIKGDESGGISNISISTTPKSAVDAFKQAALLAANRKKSTESNNESTVSSTADALKQMAMNAVAKRKDQLTTNVASSHDAAVPASKLLLQKALEKKGLSISETKKEEPPSSGFNFIRPQTPPISAASMNSHTMMTTSPLALSNSGYQQSPIMTQQPPLFSVNSSSSFMPTTPSQANMNFMAQPSHTGAIFSSFLGRKNEKELFLDDSLKHLIQSNNLDLNTFPLNPSTPLVVQDYTHISLMWSDREGKNFYYKCKKLNGEDSKTYMMHRVAKLSSSELPLPRDVTNINKSNNHLKDIDNNCNILKLHSTFVTASFMDNSLCHIYEYYPLMVQMNEFLSIDSLGSGVCQMSVDDLWFVLFQMLNVVKFIFDNNLHLASGVKDIEDFISFENFFIILNSDNSFVLKYKSTGEILVNKCLKDNSGVVKPSKGFGANVHVASCLNKVGLIWKNLVVSCNSLMNNLAINEVIKYLRTEHVELEGVTRYFEFSMLAVFFNKLQNFNELLFTNASKNFNNETFLRIIIKLNVVMSDYSDKNPLWLPNGSKYPLKLFFDYIFQNTSAKSKSLNFGHIIKNLSKLDSGIYENCVLSNNEKTTCLIISFRDLKMLVDVNFSLIMNQSNEHYQ
ncbi:hypothetical protein QEN19_002303 [Hanseniaspora menglaensis]